MEQIAKLRSAKAEGFEERDFYSWIAEEDDTALWDLKYEEACAAIRQRVEQRTGEGQRYQAWIEAAVQFQGSPWERALRWRKTEVVVEKDIGQAQTELSIPCLARGGVRCARGKD